MQNFKFTSVLEFQNLFYASVINTEILKSAVKLGIFEGLKSTFKSVEEIRNFFHLKASNRNLYDFLDILVMFGLLQKGIEETA